MEGVVAATGMLISVKAHTIATATVSVPGSLGQQEIAFAFRGSDIRAANIDGPYQLVLEGELVHASAKPIKVAQTYRAQQFDLVTHKLEYDITQGEDFGVDLDGDRRYDELHITLKLKNIGSGEGWANAYLKDTENRFLSFYLLPVSIISPRETIELIFQGVDIHENQTNGPYSLELFWFAPITRSKLIPTSPYPPIKYESYGKVLQAWAYIPYATQPYSYTPI